MGFLSSIFKRTPKPLQINPDKFYDCPPATIVYGTKTGNAQMVAQQLQKTLKQNNIESDCFNLSKYDTNRLFSEKLLLIVMSTDGEGELPPNSRKFYRTLTHADFPELTNLKYSVLALGDSSYEFFCGAGKLIDEQLNTKGAQSIMPRIDCDVDFKDDALKWIENVYYHITNTNKESNNKEVTPPAIEFNEPELLQATLTKRKILTKGRHEKATYHIVLDNSVNKIEYQSGDCIEIFPENPDQLVTQLIATLQIDPNLHLAHNDKTIEQQLKYDYELTKLNRKVVRKYQSITASKDLQALIDNHEELNHYVADKDVLDLVKDYPASISAESFIKILSPLQSRYYSIASGYKAYRDEIHLTIKTIRFEAGERQYEGAASTYINEGLQKGSTVKFRLTPSPTFHLPDNDKTPVIMIGVGTGIAPYLGFLQDRKASDTKGNNWLIWGDKKQLEDFLYESELIEYEQLGYLKHLDVCFSRDQQEKIYVQHLLTNKAAELYDWIKAGAHIYLCGHTHMGHDVRNTLSDIIMTQKGISKEKANNEIVQMQESGIIHEDLY
nr:flavodoxin domain-containing protein [uncultured Carboxylicivirga sp.]